MTTASYDSGEEDWDGCDDETDEQLPRRPRRQFFNRRTASLAALVMCAAGFYAGVRVEKGQLSSSTSAASGFSLSAAPRAGAGSGAAAGNAPSGVARGAFAGLPGSSNASFGTVSSIDGKTIYLTDSSGNTVKVRLSSATKISKSLRVSKKSVRPGDTVVIQGLKNSRATLIATSVSDSGAGGTAGSLSGNRRSSSGSSAVGSLFGAGGAGGG